jgi:hypothetical protein
MFQHLAGCFGISQVSQYSQCAESRQSFAKPPARFIALRI